MIWVVEAGVLAWAGLEETIMAKSTAPVPEPAASVETVTVFTPGPVPCPPEGMREAWVGFGGWRRVKEPGTTVTGGCIGSFGQVMRKGSLLPEEGMILRVHVPCPMKLEEGWDAVVVVDVFERNWMKLERGAEVVVAVARGCVWLTTLNAESCNAETGIVLVEAVEDELEHAGVVESWLQPRKIIQDNKNKRCIHIFKITLSRKKGKESKTIRQ